MQNQKSKFFYILTIILIIIAAILLSGCNNDDISIGMPHEENFLLDTRCDQVLSISYSESVYTVTCKDKVGGIFTQLYRANHFAPQKVNWKK